MAPSCSKSTASSASAAKAHALATSSSGSATRTGNRLGSPPQLSRTLATPSQTTTESWRTKTHPKEGDDVTDRCFPFLPFSLPLSIAHTTALIYLLFSCRFSLLSHLPICSLYSRLHPPSNHLSSEILVASLLSSFVLRPSVTSLDVRLLFSLSTLTSPHSSVCVVSSRSISSHAYTQHLHLHLHCAHER